MAQLGKNEVEYSTLVGITGAQGVGKSTFARRLYAHALDRHCECTLMDDLGATLRQQGHPLGMNATPETVAAVAAIHLQRSQLNSHPIILLERCVVDMMAYITALGFITGAQLALYQEVAKVLASKLRAVYFVRMLPDLAVRSAPHESVAFRQEIDRIIPDIIAQLGIAAINVDLADPNHVTLAFDFLAGIVKPQART